MPCKIDHSDPDSLPVFLCRVCHPELNRTAAQKSAAVAEHKAELDVKLSLDRARRALHDAQAQLADIARRGAVKGTPRYRASKSLPIKIAKLQSDIAELEAGRAPSQTSEQSARKETAK